MLEPASVLLAGVVVDPRGAPVASASLYLGFSPAQGGWSTQVSIDTDERGAFEIRRGYAGRELLAMVARRSCNGPYVPVRAGALDLRLVLADE